MEHVEKRLEKVEEKLDRVHLDVSGAKKIAWAFGVILSIMGAIGLVGLNKILDLVIAHYSK
jgi:tetrahydromethanopterin S-methyltransferase subunit G